MKVLRCEIANFGCYCNRSFSFASGLNPYCLKNGEGKTTLASFIKAMLYSLEKSGKNSYERKRYKPYSGGLYGGSMEIELDGGRYRIERTFADSPAKDALKIYDDRGKALPSFLSKPLSELQGEAGSLLGEMILGIDAEAFKRCNFVSSNDLDFSSSESIKMKIGNIVLDKERENSYEETISSIRDNDLREKAPTTTKKENAYPFRIKDLRKAIKAKEDEIKGLDQLSEGLNELYESRNSLAEKIEAMEKEQKGYAEIHVQKGKWSTVESFDSEIRKQSEAIEGMESKYQGKVPSKDESEALRGDLEELDRCISLDRTYALEPSDVDRLQSLEGKIPSEEEYESLLSAKSKIEENSKGKGLVEIDSDRYEELKKRFEGKEGSIKADEALQKDYFDCRSLAQASKNFGDISPAMTKDLPSENVLAQIGVDVGKYNACNEELTKLSSSYKEPSPALKILLIIITFGIYALVLKSKKKAFETQASAKRIELKKIGEGLDGFFARYGKNSGSYELRLEELKDESRKQESLEGKKASEQAKAIQEELGKKESALLLYFSLFGYSSSSLEEAYASYVKDLREYREMRKDEERNLSLKKEEEEANKKAFSLIEATLSKYGLARSEDLAAQLAKLRSDMEFYKKTKPVYLNKKANEERKLAIERKIKAILSRYGIASDGDLALKAKEAIKDVESYAECKERKAETIEKKASFIKENGLEGFVPEEVEEKEEELRAKHEQASASLRALESQIEENERRIAEKETFQSQIDQYNEKIEEYEERIGIAELAAKALEEAHASMEATFIDPIKDAFVGYASKIHEKIGSGVSMDYDYEIKYDVAGQLREAKGLSDGERTIMMLALRFAVLDSMYKERDSLIVLDDPFESLDAEKLPKAIALLKDLAKDWQIIYFTCHESREIKLP